MKKILFTLTLLLFFLTGCVGLPVIYECNCPTEEEKTETTEPIIKEGSAKTGLAIVTSASKSKGQKVEYDVTIVGVTVDNDGVITACKIDSVGVTVELNTDGTIKTDITKEIKSKQELKDSYGMVAYGGAKAEWYKQADALAKYCVGKTAAQVEGIAVDQGTKPTDADLSSSVTIAIGGYKSVIVKAVNNAKNLGANSTEDLNLAVNASIKSSVNATSEKSGTVQLDLDAALVTDKEDVITSCVIDSVQAKVQYDTTGTITTDVSKEMKTKNELGKDYGMVAWGGAKYEWNEQTASFCEYVKGKTAAQVAGIAVDQGTKPTDTDLSTSVTIAIGGFKALIAEALA